jgi:hypothetical protein
MEAAGIVDEVGGGIADAAMAIVVPKGTRYVS